MTKKTLIFQQGNCMMNVLHPSLLKLFTFSIFSRDLIKNSTLGYCCKSTFGQIHRKLQLWWLFRRWLLCSVPEDEIFHPTLRHMFHSPKPSNIYGESDFVNSILQNKLEKYTFLLFKKESFISSWRKIYVNSSKNMLISLLVDIIFPRTLLL